MLVGQLLARPSLYGTALGRSWAHVFWLGFALFAVPLLTRFVFYVAYNPRPAVIRAGWYQLIGTGAVTVLVAIFVLVVAWHEVSSYGSTLLTAQDGDARRGVSALWAFFVLLFTAGNLLGLAWQLIKIRRRTS
jgi:hypothetical protein